MKSTVSLGAALALIAFNVPALAQTSIDERLANMERRVQYLEQRIADQDKVIVEKERVISRLEGQEDAWFNGLEIGGVVEVEGAYAQPDEGDSASDIAIATVELGVAAEIHDWVGAEIVVLYEGEDVEIDVATLTIAPHEDGLSLTAGQQYAPFGTFETNMVSDPLTLELGEAGETGVLVGASLGGLSGSAFVFKGDNNSGGDDRIGGFGAAVGHAMEFGGIELGLDVSYINDISDSDGITDALGLGDDVAVDRVPGLAAGVQLQLSNLSFISEVLTALEDFQADEMEFDGGGARPSSWMVEAAYSFDLAGREATVAVGYQGTEEALALELPETRALAALSVPVVDGVALAVEWANDSHYGTGVGGSGGNDNNVTVQLAAEF